MVKPSRVIASAVESGEYFAESRAFYFSQYLMPLAHKAIFSLLGIMLLVGAYTIYELAQSTYVSKKYPFAIIATDETKFFPLLKSIAVGNEPINLSIARYFTTYYVQEREHYNYQYFSQNNLQDTMDKIEALSTRKVFFDYQNYIDPTQNPDAPLLRYRNAVRRDIRIDKADIPFSKLPYSAKVYFTAIERDANGGKNEESYVAELDFNMADMNQVIDKKVALTFLVVRYRTYKL